MPEQSFRSPGFFEQEIDLSAREAAPLGVPAGVIGASQQGPAFVPVSVGTFNDFLVRFGGTHPEMFGPYAVQAWLARKDACTFVRVLGAGANLNSTHIAATRDWGYVNNAGFVVSGNLGQLDASTTNTRDGRGRVPGAVVFLAAQHRVPAASDIGYPVFTDNDSFPSLREAGTAAADAVNLIRGMIFTCTSSQILAMNYDEASYFNQTTRHGLSQEDTVTPNADGLFKLGVFSWTNDANPDANGDANFSKDMGINGLRIYTASLDPSSENYISRVLNTDPSKFQREKHLLYLDYAVEDEIASVKGNTTLSGSIALLSGSTAAPLNGESGNAATFREQFGRFDTRYTTPRTPTIISQPYGRSEYDLFHFETISDGQYANEKYKISISTLRASTKNEDPYGTFDVLVRKFDDTDKQPEVLERFNAVSLNPAAENYIARVIGDKKVFYNFDAELDEEKRLEIRGKYPNRSVYIRVQMNANIEKGEVPASALPFGFKGIPVLKTSPSLKDPGYLSGSANGYGNPAAFDSLRLSSVNATGLTGSLIPPLPFRFKQTAGNIKSSGVGYVGDYGTKERVDSRYYWGVKFTRTAETASLSNAILNPNAGSKINPLVRAYSKFQGLEKMDALYTGSAASTFGNNKFTLARVALNDTLNGGHISYITGTAATHMIGAAYIRNGDVDGKSYTVADPIRGDQRITFATLVQSSSLHFNRFTGYAKFSTMFYGGFDGFNILDTDIPYLNDKAASIEGTYGGKAGDSFTGGLGLVGTDDGTMSGVGLENNIVNSYRKAIEIMTDPTVVNTNILVIPGIRDTFVTDYAAKKNREYQMSMYVMDIPNWDENQNRLFIDSSAKPDVRETAEQFDGRQVNNNYAATYFPDVFIEDDGNNRIVQVPASIATMQALAYNDAMFYPWFAPAGFNRGGLSEVTNVKVRLNSADRDELYDARINPIAVFPNSGYVIFGQKTLQINQSALDRVNVRRMLLEVKRQIIGIARQTLFEQNNPQTRAKFISQASPKLALIQAQQGIDSYRIIMDDTNNSEEDRENNRLNGKIVLVPTRAIEFISIDFIITNAGVEFA